LESIEDKKKLNSEIKKNFIISSKVLKKNQILNRWEEYYFYLSERYIYFYANPKDENYSDYLYIHEAKIILNGNEKNEKFENEENEEKQIRLKNKFNSIELKFNNNETLKNFLNFFQKKEATKFSNTTNENFLKNEEEKKSDNDNEENLIIDNKAINFCLDLKIKNAAFDILEEKEEKNYEKNFNNTDLIKKFDKINDKEMRILFSFNISDFCFVLNMKALSMLIGLSISDIKFVDANANNKDFSILIKNTKDKEVKKDLEIKNKKFLRQISTNINYRNNRRNEGKLN
jgi:hypothetical protein